MKITAEMREDDPLYIESLYAHILALDQQLAERDKRIEELSSLYEEVGRDEITAINAVYERYKKEQANAAG